MRIRFGSFVLDGGTRQLTRDGREVHLTPKAFEMLLLLLEERPRVLSKTNLLTRLWRDTFVAEANLSNLVAEIRNALADGARNSKWIRTAHGFGYAFCGEVRTTKRADRAAADRSVCWLEWKRKRFPLFAGDHILGRDPDVEVRLDAPTVSRRHARLVVTAEGTSLEDFGSKNGTRLNSEPVVASVQLADGDAIHLGSACLTFHLRSRSTTTVTQARVSGSL